MLLIFLTLLLNLCFAQILEFHCIDVGQGDALLLRYFEGTEDVVVLVDAGSRSESQKLSTYLKNKKITKIDYLVATHPHEDHIGGMSNIIAQYPIGAIYMPQVSASTKTFLNLLETIKKKNMKITKAQTGVSFSIAEKITFSFLGPVRADYENLNNYSAVIHVRYGDITFLLMGDAEKEAEYDIVRLGYDIRATVLKVGHHGSNSSTSPILLNAVRPVHAIISVGQNNYGHPHNSILSVLPENNTYRTDYHGSVVFSTDGSQLSITTGKKLTLQDNMTGVIIGNVRSKVYHYPDCDGVTSMSEKNKIMFNSVAEAVDAGFAPCGRCKR